MVKHYLQQKTRVIEYLSLMYSVNVDRDLYLAISPIIQRYYLENDQLLYFQLGDRVAEYFGFSANFDLPTTEEISDLQEKFNV